MREKQGREALKLYVVEGLCVLGWGGALEVERSSSAVREGCNAETCREKGAWASLWNVACLPPQKVQSSREGGEREEGAKTRSASSLRGGGGQRAQLLG